MTPRAVVVLRSRAQLDALVSPVRLEILERLKARDAVSIAELARTMDRKATALTDHVRRLVAAGVLVPAGERRTSGRTESLYALPGREIAIGVVPGSSAAIRAASRSASMILRLAEREVRRALDALTP